MPVVTYTGRGGFSYRRYRRSPRAPLRGGRKKLRPAKKKKKQELCFFFFFFLKEVFFHLFYVSNQYFDIKKKSNIRLKLAKNRKRKGYVCPWCCQIMLAQ